MAQPGNMQASVFNLYSIGTAAENIVFGVTDLEVWPSEQRQALDGDVTTNQENISVEGQDAVGRKYTQNINTGNVIKAKWLSRDTHRPYPGLIRRGEKVMIWRSADSDEYFWEEMGTDIRYRRGDMWTIACISTVVGPDDPISMENAYWFEIDSLNGVIRLSTTQLNGEACTYLFEFMTRDGMFRLQDSIGNYLRLDSVDQRWRIVNAAETTLDMHAENTTLSMNGKFTINAQNWEANIQDLIKFNATDFVQEIGNSITVKATTKEETITSEYSLNTTTAAMLASATYSVTSAAIGLNGPLTSMGMGGGAGSAKFVGSMAIEGDTTMIGAQTVDGTITNNGINVSTHKHRGDSGGQTGNMQ